MQLFFLFFKVFFRSPTILKDNYVFRIVSIPLLSFFSKILVYPGFSKDGYAFEPWPFFIYLICKRVCIPHTFFVVYGRLYLEGITFFILGYHFVHFSP